MGEAWRRVVHADVSVDRSPSGLPLRHLVSARDGARALYLGEQWLQPGDRVRLHTHPVEEVLTFLAGSGEATLDGETVAVGAGVSLFVPPGVAHGFRCVGHEPLRLLVLFPGGRFAATTMVDDDGGRG